MINSAISSILPGNSSKATTARRLLIELARRSRLDPVWFATFCFTDPGGRPLRPAAIHRDLQTFLTDHPRALVELPRDHGKSVQVCIRLLWELGRNPGLRIRIVCATEALAAERGRFMRDAFRPTPDCGWSFRTCGPGGRGRRPASALPAPYKSSARVSPPSASVRALRAREPICWSAMISST